jgi:hypothetical protein
MIKRAKTQASYCSRTSVLLIQENTKMIRTITDTSADLDSMEVAIRRMREVIYAKPFFRGKFQLLAQDLDAVGIQYSWDLSENDHKKLG